MTPGTASSTSCGSASARPPSARTPPSRACIDSQSVKTDGGGQEVGTDGGKKVRGRKRHIIVDTMGLLLAVVVTATNVDDAAAARRLFAQIPSSGERRSGVPRPT
jgi:putative transposase